MYDQGLYHPWVPKKFQVILSLIFVIPIMVASGIYKANSSQMYSGLGEYSEVITFANYASVIGMIIAMTMIAQVRMFFRSKEILVGSLFALSLFNILVARSSNPALITLYSFLMGYFKMFGMISVIPPIMTAISPNRDRGIFYSVFYPIILGSGQVGAYLTADLAYNLNWRYVYIIMALILLACSLLAFLFVHNKRPGKQIPITGLDWKSMGLLTLMMFILNYLLVYAKQQEWLDSDHLKIACGAFILSLVLFVYRQHNMERPMIPLRNLIRRNVVMSIFFAFMMGMYLATSLLQSAFTSVLKYDSLTINLLNLAMVPGLILGGVVAFQWFKKVRTLKPVFFTAFSAFQGYTISMYFLVNGQMDIRYFIIPLFLKGLGMCLAYIGMGFYFAQLPPGDFLKTMPILIVIRSFVGVALFSAVLSWGMNALQWSSMYSLTGHLDAMNPFGLNRGGGMAMYSTIKTQATLVAAKELFGFIALTGMVILIFILLFPFRRMHHRKLVIFKKKIMLQSTRGYRSRIFEEDKELAEIAAAAAP